MLTGEREREPATVMDEASSVKETTDPSWVGVCVAAGAAGTIAEPDLGVLLSTPFDRAPPNERYDVKPRAEKEARLKAAMNKKAKADGEAVFPFVLFTGENCTVLPGPSRVPSFSRSSTPVFEKRVHLYAFVSHSVYICEWTRSYHIQSLYVNEARVH